MNKTSFNNYPYYNKAFIIGLKIKPHQHVKSQRSKKKPQTLSLFAKIGTKSLFIQTAGRSTKLNMGQLRIIDRKHVSYRKKEQKHLNSSGPRDTPGFVVHMDKQQSRLSGILSSVERMPDIMSHCFLLQIQRPSLSITCCIQDHQVC